MVIRPSCLYNGYFYTGKNTPSYRKGPIIMDPVPISCTMAWILLQAWGNAIQHLTPHKASTHIYHIKNGCVSHAYFSVIERWCFECCCLRVNAKYSHHISQHILHHLGYIGTAKHYTAAAMKYILMAYNKTVSNGNTSLCAKPIPHLVICQDDCRVLSHQKIMIFH